MDPIVARIEAWQRAGLIDQATADRLRADEAAQPSTAFEPPAVGTASDRHGDAPAVTSSSIAPAPPRPGYLSVSSVFGRGITIGEMFGYLGAGFILGAWTAFVGRISGSDADPTMIGAGALLAAVGLVALALVLGTTGARRRRAAGVALVIAVLYTAAAVGLFMSRSRLDPYAIAIVVTVATMGVAAAFRLLLPSLLTTLALVGSITAFGWAVLAYVASVITPPVLDFGSELDSTPPSPLPSILIAAVGWLVVALLLGILAVAEDRAAPDGADDPDGNGAARRRSTLIRAWAGLVAVWGLASAVTTSTPSYINDSFEFGRVIPAWIGDAAILALALVLLQRAFHRDSGAFLFAAGIGFATALTDFNFSYLTESRDLGLLIEGGILLAVGFGAERFRRRMPGARPPAPPTSLGRANEAPSEDPLSSPVGPLPEPHAESVGP
jgi:hypothetical protein